MHCMVRVINILSLTYTTVESLMNEIEAVSSYTMLIKIDNILCNI